MQDGLTVFAEEVPAPAMAPKNGRALTRLKAQAQFKSKRMNTKDSYRFNSAAYVPDNCSQTEVMKRARFKVR